MDFLAVRESLFHFCSFRSEKILTPRFFFCRKSPSFGANPNIMRTTSTRGHSDQRVAPDIARSRLNRIRVESDRAFESPLTSQDQIGVREQTGTSHRNWPRSEPLDSAHQNQDQRTRFPVRTPCLNQDQRQEDSEPSPTSQDQIRVREQNENSHRNWPRSEPPDSAHQNQDQRTDFLVRAPCLIQDQSQEESSRRAGGLGEMHGVNSVVPCPNLR